MTQKNSLTFLSPCPRTTRHFLLQWKTIVKCEKEALLLLQIQQCKTLNYPKQYIIFVFFLSFDVHYSIIFETEVLLSLYRIDFSPACCKNLPWSLSKGSKMAFIVILVFSRLCIRFLNLFAIRKELYWKN